jgi:hypothetical protein
MEDQKNPRSEPLTVAAYARLHSLPESFIRDQWVRAGRVKIVDGYVIENTETETNSKK